MIYNNNYTAEPTSSVERVKSTDLTSNFITPTTFIKGDREAHDLSGI